ncbi:MAG: hypothetical protein U0946_05430 [Patescibacteria group bacterium]|nr:hypothetical protein [Patescibacteria group bacterium]
MMYYRDSVTQASWKLLRELKQQFNFCLIGGWAVWLYTRQLKSKDIDLVIGPEELSRIRQKYELFKNERLKKYEFRQGEAQVDIYSSYYSDLGVKAEKILTDCRTVEGFLVPSPELLFILKLVAWLGRRGSPKGRKDLIDLISLLQTQKLAKRKLKQAGMKILVKELKLLVSLPELNLNQHQLARAKKKWLLFLDSQ